MKMTKEELTKLIDDISHTTYVDEFGKIEHIIDIADSVNIAQEKGYIKKTELEITRENFLSSNNPSGSFALKYIHELEKEVERLKNANN